MGWVVCLGLFWGSLEVVLPGEVINDLKDIPHQSNIPNYTNIKSFPRHTTHREPNQKWYFGHHVAQHFWIFIKQMCWLYDLASPVCQWDLCELDRPGLPGIGDHRNKQCIKQDKWDHWIFPWPKFPEKFCVKGLVTGKYDKTLRVLVRALNGTAKGSFHILHLAVSLVSAQEMLLPSHLTVVKITNVSRICSVSQAATITQNIVAST